MKKVFAMLLAVVMVLAMGMTAFASPSSEAKPVIDPIKTETPNIWAGPVDKESATQIKNVATSINPNAEVLAASWVEYYNPDAEEPWVFPAGGMSIKLEAAGVKKGDNIVVLHLAYDKNTGESRWEQLIPSEVGDGYVVAFFKTLSPVAIVKLPAGSAAATGTSPKTGYWG